MYRRRSVSLVRMFLDTVRLGCYTMYTQSKPTSCAILALKPSYTPGASMMSFSASSWRRRVAAGMDGWSLTSVMVKFSSNWQLTFERQVISSDDYRIALGWKEKFNKLLIHTWHITQTRRYSTRPYPHCPIRPRDVNAQYSIARRHVRTGDNHPPIGDAITKTQHSDSL